MNKIQVYVVHGFIVNLLKLGFSFSIEVFSKNYPVLFWSSAAKSRLAFLPSSLTETKHLQTSIPLDYFI